MPTIASIETLLVQLPTRREHKWTGLTEVIGRYLLTRITDSDGRVGWGEAPALKDWGGEFGRYFGESTLIAKAVMDFCRAGDRRCRARQFRRDARPHGRGDQGLSICQGRARFRCLRRHGPLARPAGAHAAGRQGARASGHALDRTSVLADAEQEVAKVAAEGIRTIKIKVGGDAKRDIEIVRAIRAAVGDDVELCVDANEGYRTPGEAITTVRAMEQYRLKYVEQPVMGIERIAEVARAIDPPVMADESAWNAHDVIQIAERRAAQIVSIYTTKPGGLYKAMEVAAVCRAAGIVCNVNGSIETGVGNLANVQLAAAAPAVTLSCVWCRYRRRPSGETGQIGGIFYRDDLIAGPMKLVDGAIEVEPDPAWASTSTSPGSKYRVRD